MKVLCPVGRNSEAAPYGIAFCWDSRYSINTYSGAGKNSTALRGIGRWGSLIHRDFDAGLLRLGLPGVRRPGAWAPALPSSWDQAHSARIGREFWQLAGEVRVFATRARYSAKPVPISVLAPFPAPAFLLDSRPCLHSERGWASAYRRARALSSLCIWTSIVSATDPGLPHLQRLLTSPVLTNSLQVN